MDVPSVMDADKWRIKLGTERDWSFHTEPGRDETRTAKMGQDVLSVVDGALKVYGIDKLRIADGSIMPRVTTGNTMAPCVVIGERAGKLLKRVL